MLINNRTRWREHVLKMSRRKILKKLLNVNIKEHAREEDGVQSGTMSYRRKEKRGRELRSSFEKTEVAGGV
jgi:hypothetical protein